MGSKPSSTAKVSPLSPSEKRGAQNINPEKQWINPQYHDDKRTKIKRPHEIENEMCNPSVMIAREVMNRVHGSMIGMALGDTLGASVEFRPRKYLLKNPVTDLQSGGTWGLQKGQFTDDTSMALCLASSLVTKSSFVAYDQLVRYKLWYRHGYMSSTGECFDIGKATRNALEEFERRQQKFAKEHNISLDEIDHIDDPRLLKNFNTNCGGKQEAGNGALMRLAPVPLFFHRDPEKAVHYSGESCGTTHGHEKAYDACRYYGALIVAALHGESKEALMSPEFYDKHRHWFGKKPLHDDVEAVAKGSYRKKEGYDDGIRGKGYIVTTLEAALWAFWADENSFEKGALLAVNLGDDTDTTATIYGQLAGAFYGYNALPKKWIHQIYARRFIEYLSKWIVYEGDSFSKSKS
ncbi:unnamed protein product [Rotaria sordida]|uniref:ADP-ribosylglycohydrolase n=1 Tax=Rotaria sordida TaxID=392033 RepID=A0A818UNE8_9BILA|nr:unnamed protein product [Rotaria sordida]